METSTPQAVQFYQAAGKILQALRSRWQDEEGHENIELYLLPLSPIANEADVVLAAMTKRPFGVKFRVVIDDVERVFWAFIKGNTYQYKRIT